MDLRIFLSSTHDDLIDAREKILKLLSVLPADLVHMETFGSDETKPTDYCLRRVRGSNLFIGVYAERYGTIDPVSGRSITELEYLEAAGMLDKGELLGLLVYVLDPTASWGVQFVDREANKVEALAALKAQLQRRHTIAFFKNPEELSLQVLHDVLRKIGVGAAAVFRPRRSPRGTQFGAKGPLGMEHYTERDAAAFRGREDAVADLSSLIENSALALLVGDSGIGKTSLIQAGLFPALRAKGWAVASCRPLDNPDENISTALWSQLMEGLRPPAALGPLLKLTADAYDGQRVLVVIDQLEDIISSFGTGRISNLIAALSQFYASPSPNLHLLLAYRGDAEPKVGKYWQTVSGSASGLPRYYLQPLSPEGTRSALAELLRPLTEKTRDVELDELLHEITVDLRSESIRSLGVEVYPPFLQMIAETVFKRSQDLGLAPDAALYRSLGRAREIIGAYLGSRLRLLGPRGKESRAILISLAAPTRRLRKTTEELSTDTGLPREAVELSLADLASLRLVHPVGANWEITHDFLAQKVIEDLVAPEEREARVFRDVLAAKAAALRSTGQILSLKEHLGIYAHRSKINPSVEEAELLFLSCLAGNGPVGYFLRAVEPALVVAWAQHRANSEDASVRQNVHRYLIDLGVDVPFRALAEVFSEHKLQAELAGYIGRFATAADTELLLRLRRKKAEFTREAAYQRLESLLDLTSRGTLQRLIRSARAPDIRLLCRLLISSARPNQLPEYRARLKERALVSRVPAICGVAAFGTAAELEELYASLSRAHLPVTEREIVSYAVAHWAQSNRRPELLMRLLGGHDLECRGALSAIDGNRAGLGIDLLLKQYRRLPFEVASAVRRTARKNELHELKRFVSKVRLAPPARDLIIALLSHSGARTVRWVANLIASKDYEVTFWNVPALAAFMSQAATAAIKPWLESLATSDEFWEYPREGRGKRPLPVTSPQNLYLFKRLVGISLAGLCCREDWDLLRRLVFHDYWLIQSAAAKRIVSFATVQQLDELVEEARRTARGQADPGVIYALRLLDEKLYHTASPPEAPDGP